MSVNPILEELKKRGYQVDQNSAYRIGNASGYRRAAAPYVKSYSDLLNERLQLGLQYAQQGPEYKKDLADSISPGGAMTAYKKGDISAFDWDTLKQAEMDRVAANTFYRSVGAFDNTDYAFNKGYVHLTSTDYLKSLLPSLEATRTAWNSGGEEDYLSFIQRNSAVKNKLADMDAQGRNYYDTDALTEADLLWFDQIINGNERWRPNYASQEDVDRYNSLVDQWASVEDWENFDLAQYLGIEAPKAYDESNYKTIISELERRAALEAMQADIRSNANYSSLSVYSDPGITPKNVSWAADREYEAYVKGYDDLSRFINSGAVWSELMTAADHNATVREYMSKGYDYISADELADYNALINAGRTEEAAQYLELLLPELQYRRAMVLKEYQSVKATNPWLAAPTWVEAGLQGIANVFYLPQQIYETATGKDNPWSSAWDAYNKQQWTGEAQIGEIHDADIPDWLKTVATYGYQGVTGFRDNAMRILAGGGSPTASLIIAGLQSGSGSLHESSERDDMSGAAKIIKAIGTAAVEMGTEKVGLDALFSKGKNGALAYMKNVILSEVGEEVLNAASEPVLESVVAFLFDHEADIMSGPEFWKNLSDTAITTAISSIFMGGGGAISNEVGTRGIGIDVTNNGDLEGVLRIAESYSNNADVATPAQKIRDKQAKGFKVSNRDVGELVTAVSSAIGEKNSKAVTDVLDTAIEGRLEELGEAPENAKKLAPALRNVYQGKKLTMAERASLKWTDAASQVFKELNSTETVSKNVVPGSIAGTEGQLEDGKYVASDALAAEKNRVGHSWKTAADEKIVAAQRDAFIETAKLNEALNTKTSTTTAVGKAHDKAKNLLKGKPKMATREVMAESSDGKEVTGTFERVERKNGKLLMVMKDASDTEIKVDADKITNGGDEGILTIINYAQEGARHEMSADEVNTMVNTYLHEGGDVDSFVQQFQDNYLSGYSGVNAPAGAISGGIASIAYEQGKAEAIKDEADRVARAQKARKVETPSVGWLGDVTGDDQIKGAGDVAGLDTAMQKMTDTQQALVEFGKRLAETAKINIAFFASKAGADGKYTTQNGSYDPNTHTIYLDINSGASTEKGRQELMKSGTLGAAIGRVAGHELTHVLEATSPEYYGKYKQAVKAALKTKNLDYASLVREKINVALATGEKLTYAGAEAEVIADASEYMLQDSKFVKNMDQGLKGKVKEIVQKFLNKVNEAFRALTGGHIESAVLRTMTDGVSHYEKQLQDLWDMAFDEMLGADVRTEAPVAEVPNEAEKVQQSRERDDVYMAAVERGDMATAQRMVDEAAKAAGYTTGPLYHGTQKFGFTKADVSKSDDGISFFTTDSLDVAGTYSGSTSIRWISDEYDYDTQDELVDAMRNDAEEAAYDMWNAIAKEFPYAIDLGYAKEIVVGGAEKYADGSFSYDELTDYIYETVEDAVARHFEANEEYEDFASWEESDTAEKMFTAVYSAISAAHRYGKMASNVEDVGNYSLYANTQGLFVVEGNNASWWRLSVPEMGDRPVRTRAVASYAKSNGYSGVLFKNIVDNGDAGANVNAPSNVYVFFTPQEQVKSADPVTYDDSGNVIPLSERFNAADEDIRYSHRDDGSAYHSEAMTVADGIEIDDDTESAYPTQKSIRDLPEDTVTYREFISAMQPTSRMNETEKLLLKRYKENIRILDEKEKLIEEQERIIETATGDELTKAKNRLDIYRTQANRARRALTAAERDNGFARLMATAYSTLNRIPVGAADNVADATDALEKDIANLTSQLKTIEASVSRTATGQKAAFARGLFDRKQLNTVAQALKDTYGSRMSTASIADRLALAYSEIYADSGADGAKRFSEAARSLAEDLIRNNKYRFHSDLLPMLTESIGAISLSETDIQEIKNAGLTVRQYKAMLAPYVKVTANGSDLSSYVSNAEYYGNGTLASIFGDGSEGDYAMKLYETISNEKAKEADNGFEGRSEGQLTMDAMADIAGSILPLADNSNAFAQLRSEMLKYAGENAESARAVSTAIERAKSASRKATSVWHAAVKDATLVRQAVEYYRNLEEQRRVVELLEQKQLLTEQLRGEAGKLLKESQEKYQRQIDEIRLRRDLNIEIGKRTRHIKRIVKRLNDRIIHEEDYKNVKEPMKPVVHKLVQTFIDGFGNMVFDQKTADRLRSVYDEIANEDGAPEFYSDDVANWLSELSDMKEWDTLIRAEGSSSLGAAEEKLTAYSRVAEIADHIYKLVTAADEIFIDGKREKFNAFSTETGTALIERKDSKLLVGKARDAYNAFQNLLVKGNLTPQFFFEHLKNSGMTRLFDGLMRGQTEYAQAIREGQEAISDAKKRYNFYAWQNMKTGVQFHTEQGHDIALTVPQMMWVYATAKREATNKLMGTHHLDQGGFRYEAKDLPKQKGKMSAIPGSDRLHKLSQADVEKISNTLTAEQKACADELVSYLSNECAAQGNRASMELFGIKKYNEEYYFPFNTASDQRYQRSDAGAASTTNDARVKHTSFTHSLRKGANTPLVMGDFFDVIADHINLMATYSSFVVPIESMNRVMNTKINEEADGSGNDVTIRSLIGRKYGEASQKYIADLLKDLNGGPQTDNRGGLSALFRAFKRGAVMGSLSVTLQQPTAIVRAFAYVNPKYFAHITMEGNKKTWERMMKHSGTAVIKEMGKFDVGTGHMANDWIANSDIQEYNVLKRARFLMKTEGWKAAKDNTIEFLTSLPGVMDRITWTHIWKAVEAEQADQHPGMDRNSDEFLDMVGKRFDDVINHTQVYDSVLAKSQNMRSKNPLTQMSTAFMSEPTLNANLYYSAVTGDHTAGKRAGIVTSVIASNLLAAAMASLISAWNKDDDDRKFTEKYLAAFASRAVDNLNPMTMYPYLSDLWSMVSGYDIERTDMSVVQDIWNYGSSFMKKLVEGEDITWRDRENFYGTIANLFGIPGKNVSRDIRRIRNLITTDKSASSPSAIKYTLYENAIPLGLWKDSNKAYCQRLVAAVVDGDKQEAYDLWDYLTNTKKPSQNTINTNIRDELKRRVQEGSLAPEQATEILRKYAPYKDDKDNLKKPKEWAE